MSNTALGQQIHLAFGAAIALIVLLGQLGLDPSWVPNLLGLVLVDLVWDAILGGLAGALAHTFFGWSFRAFGLSTAAGTQLIQWILAGALQ